MHSNEIHKNKLGKTAEKQLIGFLEKWIDTWEQDFELTLVLGFMIMKRNSFDVVGGRMIIYPENYENGKIHLKALQDYSEGLKETT